MYDRARRGGCSGHHSFGAQRSALTSDPDREALLKRAAGLANQTLTSFILEAAEERALRVVAEANTTVVPAKYFDELLEALERPATPNPALRRAARRLARHIDQE